MRIFIFLVFISLMFITVPSAMATADIENGKKVFVKCGVCHSIEQNVSKIGPSLHGIIGRKAGTDTNFEKYSPAMKSADIQWSEENIATFLKKPREFIKGTRMIFIGLKDDKAIADVVAYLKSLSK